MTDQELRTKFIQSLVIQGLSMRKASKRLKVSYATLHRSLQPKSNLSTMMKHRMEGFINNLI